MKHILTVFLALAAMAPTLQAQDATNISHTLTLDAAIKAAIERNYDVRRSGNLQRRSEIEVTRSKDAFLPSASASGSYGYTYSLAPLEARTAIVGGDTAL